MSKSNKLALTVVFVVATAFSIAGCRAGGDAPGQALFGSNSAYSQGSGTTNSPASSGGSASRDSYGGGGSGAKPSYGGGGGSGSR